MLLLTLVPCLSSVDWLIGGGRHTQTPPQEQRKGKHNCHIEHPPLHPLVLCRVGQQRHDEHSDAGEDAGDDHDVHALVLEAPEVQGYGDEDDDVYSFNND